MSIHDNSVYRVLLNPSTGKVEITSFGLEALDATATGHYMSIDETPEWIQRKVAVLMMTNDTPPTEPVEGVGHRIDKNTFWVIQEQ
jgi:hypothetical protein